MHLIVKVFEQIELSISESGSCKDVWTKFVVEPLNHEIDRVICRSLSYCSGNLALKSLLDPHGNRYLQD